MGQYASNGAIPGAFASNPKPRNTRLEARRGTRPRTTMATPSKKVQFVTTWACLEVAKVSCPLCMRLTRFGREGLKGLCPFRIWRCHGLRGRKILHGIQGMNRVAIVWPGLWAPRPNPTKYKSKKHTPTADAILQYSYYYYDYTIHTMTVDEYVEP